MTAPISNSQFAYELPNLSYVDARWEEPSLRDVRSVPQPKRGLGAWLAARVAAFAAWRRDSEARAELTMMTDRELMDIGMNRGDVVRVFEPGFNTDLLVRGR